MGRAQINGHRAAILAVVLLLTPQLTSARGMSGGAASNGGHYSSNSAAFNPGSAGMLFQGRVSSPRLRVFVPNRGGAGAIMARRNRNVLEFGRRGSQPFMVPGSRVIPPPFFTHTLPGRNHVDFHHRFPVVKSRFPIVFVSPFVPFFGFNSFGFNPYCNDYYYNDYNGAYSCPPPYAPQAPVYVPVPVPVPYYSGESPVTYSNPGDLPVDSDGDPPSSMYEATDKPVGTDSQNKIFVRKDSKGVLYFTNVPADPSDRPLTWQGSKNSPTAAAGHPNEQIEY
jgi:hypothetical protein